MPRPGEMCNGPRGSTSGWSVRFKRAISGLSGVSRTSFLWRSTLLSVIVLAAVTLLLLSDMAGLGAHVYAALITAGDFALPFLGAAALGAFALHAANCYSWRWWKVVLPVLCIVYLVCGGLLCLASLYPECPMIVVLVHHPMVAVLCRLLIARRSNSYSFHIVIGTVSGFAGLVVLIGWVIWITSVGAGWGSETRLALEEQLWSLLVYSLDGWEQCQAARGLSQASLNNDLAAACRRIELCAVFIWSCPLLEGSLLICMALFAWLRAWYMVKAKRGGEEMFIQQVAFFVCLVIGIAWMASATAGAAMRLSFAVLRVLTLSAVLFAIWVVSTVPLVPAIEAASRSLLWSIISPMVRSDWIKAIVLSCGGVFFIAFFFIEGVLRAGERLCCCRRGGGHSYTTERGGQLLSLLSGWHWASVAQKTAISALVFVLVFLAFPKLCIVFLAWLTNAISDFDLWLVSTCYFAAGLLLFFFPPMPGLVVYMGAGVILVSQIQELGGTFWQGLAFASALSFVLKLVSIAVQYKVFGEKLAHLTRVQESAGMHKAVTRALERILKVRGLRIDKGAVLCGGPDWPTAVLCGFLGVGLRQTLLGSLPSVLLVVPYVFAGACWLDELLVDLSSVTIMLTCALQNFAFILALLMSAAEATAFRAEVEKSKTNYRQLHMSERTNRRRSRQFKSYTHWGMLSFSQRLFLILAVVLECTSFWASLALTQLCFRDFSLAHRITDDLQDGGLGGNVLNILTPLGMLLAGMVLTGAVCLAVYMAETRVRVRREIERKEHEGSAAPPSRSSVKFSTDSPRSSSVGEAGETSTSTFSSRRPAITSAGSGGDSAVQPPEGQDDAPVIAVV